MKIYMIGYGTHEESEHTYLTHEKTFSEQEFKDMVFDSTYDAIIENKKEEYSYLHGYDNIHSETVGVMKSKYGFKELETEQSWTCFGWASMFKHGDWKNNRDEPDALSELVAFLNNKGLTEDDDDFLKIDAFLVGGEQS